MTEQLRFCGNNRKRDLQRLTAIFDACLVSAADPAVSPPGPRHRVVMIEAERGLGKTRLTLEMLRHMMQAADPGGYWPREICDTVNGAVMPRPEDCHINQPPPFLWWGMVIAEGSNPGNTIFASLNDILPHMVTARLAARRKSSVKEILADARDLAIDIGIEIGPEITGLGMIKRLGQSALKIGKIIRRHRGKEEDSFFVGDQLETVVDSVLDDLSCLFDRRSPYYAKIPLVILIDDAQFADNDPAMPTFLEKLLARSAREDWPLLLVCTHWSRQLGLWKDANDQWHEPSHVAKVIEHAMIPDKKVAGVFAKEPAGSLRASGFERIDLGEPVDHLEEALRQRFPGLDEADVGMITGKSGSNPRKLEQIIARMERKPKWFDANDLKNGLTNVGREAVATLADLPIDEVVLERFMDTPADVRRSMIVASLMGSRFVVDLVDRITHVRLATDARAALQEGEKSFRFLKGIADRSQNDIGEFSEGLFFDAAKEYQESGLARQDLPDWPDADELMTTLDTLLAELVKDPDQFPKLSEDDLAEALTLAGTRMSHRGDPAAGTAFARVVQLEKRRRNTEAAYSAALHFARLVEKGERLETPLGLYWEVAATIRNLGLRDVANDLWSQLHNDLQVIADVEPENVEALVWLAECKVQLGRQQDLVNEGSAALSCYSDAAQIIRAKIETGTFLTSEPVFRSLFTFGQALQARGKCQKALAVYSELEQELEEILFCNPDDINGEAYKKLVHAVIVGMETELGYEPDADRALGRAVSAINDIPVGNPDDHHWQHALAVIRMKQANRFRDLGDNSSALELLHSCIAIYERIVSDDPDDNQWLNVYSYTLQKAAQLHLEAGNHAIGIEFSERAISTSKRLAHRSLDIKYQKSLCFAAEKLAAIFVEHSLPEKAVVYFQEAGNAASAVVKTDHNDALWITKFMEAQESIADLLWEMDYYSGAFERYDIYLKMAYHLMKVAPDLEGSANAVLHMLGKTGGKHSEIGSPDRALEYHIHAESVALDQARHNRESAHFRRVVGLCRFNTASAHVELREFDKALELLYAALVSHNYVHELAPNDVTILSELRRFHEKIAYAHWELRDIDAANSHFEKALDAWSQMAKLQSGPVIMPPEFLNTMLGKIETRPKGRSPNIATISPSS